MRGLKLLGCSMLTVVALLLVVLPASGASAAKLLHLTEEGVTVPVGSAGHAGLNIGGCTVFSEGVVSANAAVKDKIVASSNASSECSEEAGTSEEGVITEAQMTASGKATLKGKITITYPGPCAYVFSKFKDTFEVPGIVIFVGETVGKLNKKTSSLTCAKTFTERYLADAANTGFGPFEEEL